MFTFQFEKGSLNAIDAGLVTSGPTHVRKLSSCPLLDVQSALHHT